MNCFQHCSHQLILHWIFTATDHNTDCSHQLIPTLTLFTSTDSNTDSIHTNWFQHSVHTNWFQHSVHTNWFQNWFCSHWFQQWLYSHQLILTLTLLTLNPTLSQLQPIVTSNLFTLINSLYSDQPIPSCLLTVVNSNIILVHTNWFPSTLFIPTGVHMDMDIVLHIKQNWKWSR